MCSDLWGKEARNNSAILRAWDGLSQFRTMTVKTLEVVEFIEALESVDGMCAARESSVNQNPVKQSSKINQPKTLCNLAGIYVASQGSFQLPYEVLLQRTND
jgi:hypothetical protein